MSYGPPISYAKNWYTPVRYQYPKLRTEYKKTYRSLVYIGVPLKKTVLSRYECITGCGQKFVL